MGPKRMKLSKSPHWFVKLVLEIQAPNERRTGLVFGGIWFHCRMASKLRLNLGTICHLNKLLALSWGGMGFIPAFSCRHIIFLSFLPLIDSNIQRNVGCERPISHQKPGCHHYSIRLAIALSSWGRFYNLKILSWCDAIFLGELFLIFSLNVLNTSYVLSLF